MVSNFPQIIQLGSAGAIDGDHNDEDKDSRTLTIILKKNLNVLGIILGILFVLCHLLC